MTDDKKHCPPVGPGPCPIIDGVPVCPPPTEIDIIKVKKVFQECMHTQVEEVEINVPLNNGNGQLDAQCVSVEALNVNCEFIGKGLVKVTFDLRVCTQVVNEMGYSVGAGCNFDTEANNDVLTIEKTFRLSRAGEPGLECQAHVFPECLLCFVSNSNNNDELTVTCCVGILILIKLDAEVQLLVPTYGYAPEPPECDQVIGQCPADYNPVWPPYPPQDRPTISPKPCKPGKPGKPGKGKGGCDCR